nr:hypothetical protein [Tanacetum cinerariifolium]
MDEGKAATERISDDSKEMTTVLTSMDASTVLASRVVDVPTASTPAKEQVPTGSDVVLLLKVQEQIDAQVVRELEEQLDREDQRRSEQIARDAEIARIHAEKELQIMIDGLDRTNETLVLIEEVYVEALQVKHPIIDWKIYTKGQRGYWKITRLGGSLASYQFFIDLLKHLDMEDLNQLWRLVKETLSNRPPTSDKEMELWVELSRLYEPDKEDQLCGFTFLLAVASFFTSSGKFFCQ